MTDFMTGGTVCITIPAKIKFSIKPHLTRVVAGLCLVIVEAVRMTSDATFNSVLAKLKKCVRGGRLDESDICD
jgi:hypothetical protein